MKASENNYVHFIDIRVSAFFAFRFEAIINQKQQTGEDMGIMDQMKSVMSVMNQQRTEIVAEQQQHSKKHGSQFAAGAASFASILDSDDGQLPDGSQPMVRSRRAFAFLVL